jgi:hypothetical protein
LFYGDKISPEIIDELEKYLQKIYGWKANKVYMAFRKILNYTYKNWRF